MSKNALLFVGYEPETGEVVSVGGVTVLGMRDAYTPPILAERRKLGGGKGDKAGKKVVALTDEYNLGFREGEKLCEMWWTAHGSAPPGDRIISLTTGKGLSEDYVRGFYNGTEACNMRHAKGPGTWESDVYEKGRSDGRDWCRAGAHPMDAPGLVSPLRGNADYKRGVIDGAREAGCMRAIPPSAPSAPSQKPVEGGTIPVMRMAPASPGKPTTHPAAPESPAWSWNR